MDVLASAVQAALDALAGVGPNQANRLLILHTPLGANRLLAERAEVVEGIGPDHDEDDWSGFRVRLTALSTDADISLDDLVGQSVLLELLTTQSRDDLRPWHGHVTEAMLLGSDNGLARYELTIEPWLAFLRYRQDSYVFQDMTVPEIVDAVFSRYSGQGLLLPVWRWELADAGVYPRRSLCIQYQESDLAFVSRVLAEEGLFWWFEHAGDVAEPFGSHTLVVADHNGAFKPSALPNVRYTQSAAASFSEDGLQRFGQRRRVVVDTVDLASFDYRSVSKRPVQATAQQSTDVALVAQDVPGLYAYEDTAQGERLARRWLEALQAPGCEWTGEGQLRTLGPAETFSVFEHPTASGEFVALKLRHRARSNLSADAEAGLQRWLGELPHWVRAGARRGANASAEPLYALDFTSQATAQPVRAPQSLLGLSSRPSVHGTQTAIVVGDGSPVHTDRDHRVKVQFHWQRGDNSSHGLPAGDASNAPADSSSGTWVRVATSLAGDNWGTVFVPRVGQEVVVAFIEGDIDRPVVVGAAYNGVGQATANQGSDAQGNQVMAGAGAATGNAPAWFPGEEKSGDLQGHDHPAVLSGIKTQELSASADGTGGYNQFVLDDTPGQNRIELSTTTQATRLQLGYLLQQKDNQRLQPRGHGFDLSTSAFAAVRAGAGLLVSTHANGNSTTGAHTLDARSARTTLQSLRDLAQTLADSAQRHEVKADDEPAPEKLYALVSQSGLLTSLDASEEDGETSFAILGRPDLVVASPAGIVMCTPASHVAAIGGHVSMISAQDLCISSQRHHSVVSAGGIYFFTYGEAKAPAKPNTETGIRLHAATGSVSVRANDGQARFAADQNVDVASTADAVTVGAPERVLLNGAGSAIEITKGAITITTGGGAKFLAAVKQLSGGADANRSLTLPKAPQLYNEQFRICDEHTGEPMQFLPYRIEDDKGQVLAEGFTDEDGHTVRIETATPTPLKLFY